LLAVAHPQKRTGYKDPLDFCNRTDKSNGGDFRTYSSAYRENHGSVIDKKVQFREDGVPISAGRLAEKSLMAPKLPTRSDLKSYKKIAAIQGRSQIEIGNRNLKDPKRYHTVNRVAFIKHGKLAPTTNPDIAAEESKRAHKKMGFM